MREILFKGKAKHNNQWYFGYLNYDKTRKEYYILEDFGNFPAPMHEETICQYIGILDMYGAKIFENDIVEINGEIGVIEFDSDDAAFKIITDDTIYGLEGHKICCVEVMGNLYGNTEKEESFRKARGKMNG